MHTPVGNSNILTQDFSFRKVAYTRRDVAWFVEWMDFSLDIESVIKYPTEEHAVSYYPLQALNTHMIGLGRLRKKRYLVSKLMY
jgi:hypothetical protein